MSDTPERIWAFAPDIFDNLSVWQDAPSPAGDTIEYVRVDMLQQIFDRYSKAEADRIEELEAKLAKLEAAAQKAVGHITGYGEASTARIELRATLAELTGGRDD